MIAHSSVMNHTDDDLQEASCGFFQRLVFATRRVRSLQLDAFFVGLVSCTVEVLLESLATALFTPPDFNPCTAILLQTTQCASHFH